MRDRLGLILARYADTCDRADKAFTAGYITVWEKWEAKQVAEFLRDAALRQLEAQPA